MKKSSILIVEDEVTLSDFLKEYMETYFQKIYTAFDGEEAFKLYKEYRPDVIISDINLPKLNGLDLIEKIRENDKKTKVIVLSAHTDKEKLFKAIELNLETYLTKPIKSSQLKEVILKVTGKLEKSKKLQLSKDSFFDQNSYSLFVNNEEIKLTEQEKKLLSLLSKKVDHCVSYELIHEYVYELNNFSLNSITSLVKRLRKKVPSGTIITCFKEGYKISPLT